jgi:peptide/nickel transport system substrate-binding protein
MKECHTGAKAQIFACVSMSGLKPGPISEATAKTKAAAVLIVILLLAGCHSAREDSRTVVMAIENSPTNLDRRIGTDAMSERIGDLIFDPLVRMDAHYEMQPWLATSWEQPDPLTWVFHLRDGVRFQDGKPLEAQDVVWTIESMRDGSLLTSKSGAFAKVLRAEVRDRLTVVVRMKEPDASLLFNLSDSLFGVVPRGAGKDFGRRPVGSGPFRFVSQEQDKDVVIERNPDYWGGGLGEGSAKLERVRFAVIPDAVTVALELEKGSADIASNHLTLDMVHAIERRPGLKTETAPGSAVMYLNFNVAHGPLKDVRVRQAIACAMNKPAMIHAVWRDQARLASTLLPDGHWAEATGLPVCGYDPAKARALLASAGFGHGLKLEMKTSQDDTTRLVAEILQAELRDVGIDLVLRASEFGTFYSDVTAGRFEMYALRWIGSNEDPDIFRYAFGSDRTPPKGANRGHYSNARVDALLADAARKPDEASRAEDFIAVQKILAEELPAVPLWYPNNEVVHTTRVMGIVPRVDGSFDFLREAWLEGQ